jgi:hypothetical protein
MTKIFGVSLGRNATQSLAEYLKRHGLSVTHFYNYEGVPLGTFSEDLAGILSHFESLPKTDAYLDIPHCFIFEELYEKYPDAKFINITRTQDKWVASMKRIQEARSHDGDPYIFEEAYCNIYAKTGKTKIQDLTDAELRVIHERHLLKVRAFFDGKKNNYLELNIDDMLLAEKIRDFINGEANPLFPQFDDAIIPQ